MSEIGLGVPGVVDAAEVGRTPSAATFRATDEGSGRAVIVKVLDVAATPEVRARFEYDQGQIGTLVDHPGVLAVHRHGYTPDGRPFFVAELASGGSMAERVGSLDGPGVLRLGIGVAGALESAHRLQVVHGDLRPEDVMVDDGGDPLVADFGVVTVTGRGPAQSDDPRRLAHAAPEQLRGSHPTPATDVYALGSVLYSLLAAEDAFVRPGDASVVPVISRITSEAPPELRAKGVPDQVAVVIERAMAKDPGARYGSAEDLGRALQQAEIALGQPMTPMTVLGPAGARSRPSPAPLPAAAAAPGAGGPPPSGPAPASSSGAKSKAPLVLLGLAVLVAVGIGGFLVIGGDDDDGGGRTDVSRDGDDDDDGEDTTTTTDELALDLAEASDDSGAISAEVPAEFATDGAPFPLTIGADTIDLPDFVAAGDTNAFLQSFDEEGVEVTGFPLDVVGEAQGGVQLGADELFEFWTNVGFVGRSGAVAAVCTPEGDPVERTTDGGFEGVEQRFTDCDGSGNDLVFFAGVADDATTGLVVQVLGAPGGDVDSTADAVIDSATVDPALL